jgi:hypothetical protein
MTVMVSCCVGPIKVGVGAWGAASAGEHVHQTGSTLRRFDSRGIRIATGINSTSTIVAENTSRREREEKKQHKRSHLR